MVMGYLTSQGISMTKRQALLHPKSAPLSHSTPAKKTTRGPSPRRLSETEVAARLEKMGWEITQAFIF